ncbi:MAG: hypothetical protein GY952_20445 [Rhodobacteraceae bacterium]|nr:hypothetical protein [Paracoccaceae bacterium]
MKATQIAFVCGLVLVGTVIWLLQPKPKPAAPLSMTGRCVGTAAGNHCAPFVGCSTDGNMVLSGRADGFFEGGIVGDLSSGHACVGSWKAISPRMGEGHVACEDGSAFSGRYFFRNAKEGYLVAKGKSATGQTFYAVSSGLAFRTGRVRPPSDARLHEICAGLAEGS